MILNSYNMIGGVDPETASVKNILAYHGVKAPHTGQPFSEAMLLGIGGGLGAMYILWEMQKHGYPSLVLGFRNLANYQGKFLERLCNRVGCSTKVFETTGVKKAETELEKTIAEGNPAIVWLDLGGAPYYFHWLHLGVAVVYGIDEHEALIDNRSNKPFVIGREHLSTARARVPSFKNRIMTLAPSGSLDLEDAITKGLQDCIDYLSASSTSFSLPSIRKWARMMTDQKNKKGWTNVHPGGHGLYGTLTTMYEGIEHGGTGGGGLRGMYSEFLEEAAPVIGYPGLLEIAEKYKALQARWQSLAQACLPDDIEALKTTKDLIDRRMTILNEQGSEGLDAIRPINDALHQIKGELNDDFPLSEAETSILYSEIQSHLNDILQAEKDALAALKTATTHFT